MKKLLFKHAYLMSLILLIPSAASAETVLYCKEEISTGIVKKNDIYQAGRFVLQRYTIKFNNNFTSVAGLPGRKMKCHKPYSENIDPSFVCRNLEGYTFIFNPQTNRFHYSQVSSSGFIDYGNDTSLISVGSCEKF